MAKFCTKCGQAIVEGQEHICPAAEPVNNGSQINLNKEVTSDMGMANQDAAPKADAPTPIVTPDTNAVNAAINFFSKLSAFSLSYSVYGLET